MLHAPDWTRGREAVIASLPSPSTWLLPSSHAADFVEGGGSRLRCHTPGLCSQDAGLTRRLRECRFSSAWLSHDLEAVDVDEAHVGDLQVRDDGQGEKGKLQERLFE